MRTRRIEISPLLLVPLVLAGLAVLTALPIFTTTRHALERQQDPFWPVACWTLLISSFSFMFGVLVIWMFLQPMRGFADAVEALEEDVDPAAPRLTPGREGGELRRFKHATDRATELLSQMDVKRLFPGIIEGSASMRRLLSVVARIAPTEATVLITGESGTGKELIARSLHDRSGRAAHPFVAVNCAAISKDLLESELFGHEKGAFTGATARKIGKFERAEGGTVFLDEIGDMPLATQASVLRVLQEREIERVGGNSTIPVNVRFVAATNRDLSQLVAEGALREDLYYRINGCALEVPPLRMRKHDIPALVDYFLKEIDSEATISAEALHVMERHAWPGNIRELRNVVETAAALAGGEIQPMHFPAGFPEHSAVVRHGEPALVSDGEGLEETLVEIEKGMILRALLEAGGVQKRAAEILKIKERSLWHRVAKYEIDVSAVKEHVA